ncbi:hypothetical protein ACU6T4_10970 [Avibacterium paragallinarum]|uniref:hypothetical protein n=2 Tax=Avibacterium paragallinarum TaxID=728 RepID=UPI00021AD397|nr:hypothetical protein [Avibacterium paragallinarum]AZI13637.1 hypothetical protein EIA51_02660 [Avibacterium paragallinarum]QIR12049.1 hypothetical protein HBL79_07275 [Avibacterium paragallinarum]QJE09131.1 hypothetical protein HHJ62_01765 [Avibacterium paragallinarum]QJE11327.1 hypothetical protein HHJ61_01765 [Avibacterium paragallinarum]QJE13525.1 hypothetical protein HHJ60_01775 [Avibacterium paragallinarum]
MAQQKINLPPRKWYTLKQAAEKLTYEINHQTTVDDMIHYLFNGYFLPYIHIKFKLNHSIILNGKYCIDLKNGKNRLREDIHSTLELDYNDLTIFDDYCKLAVLNIERPNIPSESWVKEHTENLFDILGITPETQMNDEILDKFFSKNRVMTYGIDGLLGLKIESLYNGHSSIFEEMQIIENGLNIQRIDLFTPPIEGLENNKGAFYQLRLENPLFIPADEIIILYDDLLRIIDNVQVNLKRLADERIETTETAEKTNKTIKNKSNEESNNGTDEKIKNKKDFYNKAIFNAIKLTAEANPESGGYQIVKAVIAEIKARYNLKDVTDLYSDRHYLDKAKKELKLTFPKNSGNRKTKINVILDSEQPNK